MNEDDSMRMFAFLEEADYQRTNSAEAADLIILNTCSIRDKAEHKVYSALGRFKELKAERPEVILVVSGCVAEQVGKTLLSRAHYLDMVIGTHNVHKIAELVADFEAKRARSVSTGFRETLDPGEYRINDIKGEGVKSFVTIMRGCNNFCSYCIVPYVRGREVSRPVAEIMAEVRELATMGVREVTLVGQNVNSYDAELSFPELIRKISNEIDEILRIRFVTSHPKDISEELINLFGELPKLVNSLHLPVQSGSSSVLEGMGRGYSVDEYRVKLKRLKGLYPDMAITSDIIVGFPGEREEDFLATMKLIEDIRFDLIFSFRYSPRPGTKAADFTDEVEELEGKRRLDILQSRQKEITAEKLNALVGLVTDVLVEGPSRASAETNGSELQGRTPCNRVVNFVGERSIVGSVVKVKVTEACTNSLKGALADTTGREEKGAA